MPRLRSVPVYSWNPRRNKLPVLRRFQVGPRVKNFGDLLGPVVVQGILKERGVGPALRRPGSGTVMAVGSVMHKAHDGDIVWGTGVNGKVALALHDFTRLDVRAVRGPRTREWLRENKGIEAPAIYGDPALLLPTLFPGSGRARRPSATRSPWCRTSTSWAASARTPTSSIRGAPSGRCSSASPRARWSWARRCTPS
ncbi:hypothetical protein Q0F99_06060 [Rathayibacter oskolensis]|uniref:hypothetical protein n=1 Tax=Rathayibacter oskolensis TaxID=1891671 RepID=UPI00265D832C|nr:hypothetical protein [Rathayibacter oskolensis]WKK72506.1 hypothetical protein Q0F99_06060 [Rathayibacter oskolensis]